MDLRDKHIRVAVSSSEAMRALLRRFEELAAPGKGAPILLAALARLGTTACDWIEGELRVEIFGDDHKTTVSVSTALGGGFREKLFPNVDLKVPFDEFSRGVSRAPKLIHPLQVKESKTRLVLTASSETRKTSVPPPMVAIDPSCFLPDVPKLGPIATDVSAPGEEEGPAHVVLRKRVRSPSQPRVPAPRASRPKKT